MSDLNKYIDECWDNHGYEARLLASYLQNYCHDECEYHNYDLLFNGSKSSVFYDFFQYIRGRYWFTPRDLCEKLNIEYNPKTTEEATLRDIISTFMVRFQRSAFRRTKRVQIPDKITDPCIQMMQKK